MTSTNKTNAANKIVLASNNQKKVAELSAYLPAELEVLTLAALGIESPEETGTTFVENAIIKARHASQLSGLPAIADDSGLEVDYLQGRPGIYSARFAGEGATDADNTTHLLAAMKQAAPAERRACFRCVIVMMRHALDPMPLIASGSWYGQILKAPQGTQGFGYDPVFFDPALGRAAAELDSTEKNQVSHRGKALRALQEAWLTHD